MTNVVDLQAAERDGKAVLCSPEVGWFTRALPKGSLVAAGENAGTILALGKQLELRVPDGAHGLVANEPPNAIRQPVGFGDVLYELAPIEGVRATKARAAESSAQSTGKLALRATQSGRFYHRSAPGEPAFVTAGAIVKSGTPIGLIEVMKTFSQVHYRPGNGLPASARVLRFVAGDGTDVRAGDALIEIEAIEA